MIKNIARAAYLVLLTVILAACQSTTVKPKSDVAVSWIELGTERGETIKALFAKPPGNAKRGAVIYNHGTGVRQLGYAGAAAEGYDVKDYVRAIADAGFVALAPIREFNSASARRERGGAVGSEQDWTGAIEGGIRTVLAARAYLAGHAAVDKSKIGVIGFSEGGNVTLWSVLENNDFAAVVLMSPATLRSAGKYALRSAGRDRRMGNLKMPVLLTVGADDYPQIKRIAGRMLARRLGRSSADFKYRADYPGTHNWFHRVRAAHWADVTRFFHRHLD